MKRAVATRSLLRLLLTASLASVVTTGPGHGASIPAARFVDVWLGGPLDSSGERTGRVVAWRT